MGFLNVLLLCLVVLALLLARSYHVKWSLQQSANDLLAEQYRAEKKILRSAYESALTSKEKVLMAQLHAVQAIHRRWIEVYRRRGCHETCMCEACVIEGEFDHFFDRFNRRGVRSYADLLLGDVGR